MSASLNVRDYEGVSPQLGARVYIDDMAVVIGRVTLGDDVSMWPFTVARGDVNTIRVGARSNIQDGTALHVQQDGAFSPGGQRLEIGSDVTVGHKAMLHGCRIGDRCLIGMSSIILDGVIIEDEVIVGAGALVPPGKVLTRHGLYLGSPAKRSRDLEPKEIARLAYSAAHYVQTKDRYLLERAQRASRR
jgi:carbonic anhydrase/acetyltransferase-like protein (isoleucine patch superfamily)